jgi:hypothetical protein
MIFAPVALAAQAPAPSCGLPDLVSALSDARRARRDAGQMISGKQVISRGSNKQAVLA